ncbi:SDR family NAD(P)-dependent oxidoreductase, partial [Candidatus Thiosymbion oneisti]
MVDTKRVALIIGGSRGIGAAICKRLAAAGNDIILTYAQSTESANSVADECRKHDVNARAVRCDAGDIEAGARLVKQIVDDHGRIDILVNNAATLILGDLLNVTQDMFDSNVNVNLKGVFFLTQAVAQHMPQGGRIVNIGSVFG